jgi:predicted aspartyl protease
MKTSIIILCFAARLTIAMPPTEPPAAAETGTSAKLTLLLNEKRYLELEQTLNEAHDLAAPDRSFFSGVLASRKNQTTESLRLLEPLLLQPESGLLAVAQSKLGWLTLADDYAKSSQYGKAAKACAHVLQQFASLLGEQEKNDIESDRQSNELMKDYPARSVKVGGPFTMQTKRDALGLIEGPVEVGGKIVSAVFDTGADGSVLTMTLARQLGLKSAEATVTASGAAGGSFQGHVTLIPRLQIGDAEIRDVGAGVFEDKVLYIAPAHMQIDMIIGYPEIAALGWVTFYADGRIGVSPSTNHQGAEMFLDGNKPLIAAKTSKGVRLFNLDTGAPGTLLYDLYWNENKNAFVGVNPSPYQVLGAGGSHEVPAFNGVEVPLGFGDASVVLHHVSVLTKPHNTDPEEFFYGNLGQDLLKPLRSWSLDFRSMRFEIDPGDTTRRVIGCRVDPDEVVFVFEPSAYGAQIAADAQVHVAGDFNGWLSASEGKINNPVPAWQMQRVAGDRYELHKKLSDFHQHPQCEFKFVVNLSQWIGAPIAASNQTTGDEHMNLTLTIPEKAGQSMH